MITVLRNNRGIALILTILVVSLIIAFTIQFNRTMRAHVMSSAANENQLKALYRAKSGISCARAMLREYASPDVTTLFELKLKLNQEGTEIDEICEEMDNEELSACSLGKFKLLEHCEFEIIDECGKIQLNSLPEMGLGKTEVEWLLRRYLGEFGLKSTYYEKDTSPPWYTILNWIDTDDANRTPFDFSEDHSKNGPLDSLYELKLIEGLGPESLSKVIEADDDMPEEEGYSSVSDLFDDIIEHLTVFVANEGRININTASRKVLMSLHDQMNEEMAADMESYRCGNAVNSAALNKPDWYHKKTSVPQRKDIDQLITTESSLFRIVSTGSFGDLKKRIVAVVKRQDKKEFQILSWKIE